MNDQQRAAIQMALEALETLIGLPETEDWLVTLKESVSKSKPAITALREALAQPQGEPVALCFGLTLDNTWLSTTESEYHKLKENYRMKVYATPPSVEAAIEATKEKAAKVCEERIDPDPDWDSSFWDQACMSCAAAIRSMK